MKPIQQILLLWALIHVVIAKEENQQLDGVSHHTINSTTGVYFEKVSEIFLYSNEWNIVFHVNLSTIQEELKNVQVTVNQIDEICNNFTLNFTKPYDEKYVVKLTRGCGATLSEIKLMMNRIEEFNVDWFYINKNVKRRKRGAVNIVGNILNSLFGTLSQEDAQTYLNEFKNIKVTADETQLIIQKQTTLIKSTAKLLDKYMHENAQLYTQANDQYEKIKVYMQSVEKLHQSIWLSMEVQFEIENLLLFASLLLTSFYNRQHHFLEILSLLSNKHSQNPIVLPPELFLKELSYIQANIQEKNMKLPLDVNRDTLPYFYQIAATRSRIVDGQLLIAMSIPLVKLQPYDLIKVTSFPRKISNDLYSFVIPQHEYVAVDSFRKNYIAFTNQELENCYDLQYRSQKEQIICMQSSPINQISNRDDCSVTLLAQNKFIEKCDVRLSNITGQIWLKLKEMNAYLYVFPKSELIYIKCFNKPMEEKLLVGTGIIRIKEQCQIKSNDILIEANTVFRSHIFEEIRQTYVPNFDFDVTRYAEELQKEFKIKELESPLIISNDRGIDLKKLSNSIEELESFQRTKVVEKTYRQHNYILLFIILVAIFLIGIYFYFQAKFISRREIKMAYDDIQIQSQCD